MIDEKWNSIGGSDIAAIMEMSPYATGFDVWARIKGGFQQHESPVMRRGKLFEPVLRTIAREDYHLDTLGPKEYRWTFDGVPMRASIDDAVQNQADKSLEIIEYKTVSPFTSHNWEDGVPEHYEIQCQWYLAAAQASRAHVLALIGLDDVRHYVVEGDVALQRNMVEKAIQFWRRFVAGDERPTPGKSKLAKAYFDNRYPGINDEVAIAGTEEDASRLISYGVAQTQIKEAEERLEELKNYFRARLAQSTKLVTSYGTLTYSAAGMRETVDWQAIAKELNASPELIAKHTTEKPTARVMRAKVDGAK